jgi:hypothetical protein
VTLRGVPVGSHIVLNQNWDPGWRANGRAVLDWADLPAATVDSPDETIVFRYVPRLFWFSMTIFAATVGAIAWGAWGARKLRRVRRRLGPVVGPPGVSPVPIETGA